MPEPKYITGKKPHARERRMIFRNVDRAGWDPSIERYLKDGGYKTLSKSLNMKPVPSEKTMMTRPRMTCLLTTL